MTSQSNEHSSYIDNNRVLTIEEYYAPDTVEVTTTISGFRTYGKVKWTGGILWRAVAVSDLALLPGQRARVVKCLANSLILIVEPIELFKQETSPPQKHNPERFDKGHKVTHRWIRPVKQAG